MCIKTSSNEANYNILNDIYHNEAGYGPVITTYKDEGLKDNKKAMKYVQGGFQVTWQTESSPQAETVS